MGDVGDQDMTVKLGIASAAADVVVSCAGQVAGLNELAVNSRRGRMLFQIFDYYGNGFAVSLIYIAAIMYQRLDA